MRIGPTSGPNKIDLSRHGTAQGEIFFIGAEAFKGWRRVAREDLMNPTGPNSMRVLPPNTAAWNFQAWASWVLAFMILTRGIYLVQINPWVRGFLMMACLFTIGTTFTLSKTVRDNTSGRPDNPAWIFAVWALFVISVIATFTGIYWFPVQGWPQGFFLAAFLFQINTTFVLAKTTRDNYEAGLILGPLQPPPSNE